ncbi:MAG: hypothetical protein ABIT37_03785 [Luteolibacter sp.]
MPVIILGEPAHYGFVPKEWKAPEGFKWIESEDEFLRAHELSTGKQFYVCHDKETPNVPGKFLEIPPAEIVRMCRNGDVADEREASVLRVKIETYLKSLSDEALMVQTQKAIDDLGEAAENQRDSEWHGSCFAAVAVFAEELKRRDLPLQQSSEL